MIVASPDGFASDLRRNLDNWETAWIAHLRMEGWKSGLNRNEKERIDMTRLSMSAIKDAYSGHFVDVLGLRQGA
jgi:hypothetical protein